MRNRALWLVCALLAVNAVLLAAQPSFALPRAIGAYLLGPKMLRAEVIVMDGRTIHDYRLDRGRIQRLTAGSITVAERDGTVVTVPVSGTTNITLNGRAVPLSALRRGFNVLTIRDGASPAQTVAATRR